MPKSTGLDGCLDGIEVGVGGREATPRLLLKLSIQLHLAGLSLSNTVSILDVFGVDRARSSIHNWVHKAGLQPASGRTPDHVAVDETVIRLDDQRYWLYAVIIGTVGIGYRQRHRTYLSWGKRRSSSFSNCFSHADQETADEWLQAVVAWNQLI